MTKEEAREIFLSRGYVEVEGGTIYDANKWRESCCVISEWLEQESKIDVLDKIRAEMLEEMLSHCGTGEEVIQAYADGLKKGLEFIDKYNEKNKKRFENELVMMQTNIFPYKGEQE